MSFNKQTVRDADVSGKRVLLRCDFNVPLDKNTGEILSDKRICASLPTIRYLLDRGARVIVCSHLGRPNGEFVQKLSLAPVANRLSELLRVPVVFANDAGGEDSLKKAAQLKDGGIMFLENIRFYKGEEENDPEFAKKLAALGDLYVNDAFGTVHRAHASTVSVASFLPAYAGLLLEKEITLMSRVLSEVKYPSIAILGGAKVSDKILLIKKLVDTQDAILIGGGMAYTFLKGLGHDIGTSLFEADRLREAMDVYNKASEEGVRLLLPIDHVTGDKFSADCKRFEVDGVDIPDGQMGLDIGPKTIDMFIRTIKDAGTIIWNGPMGVSEFPGFENGTKLVAEAVADCPGMTIVGGGESAAAVSKYGLEGKITHVSTGGGASLRFLEGTELPGIACLLNKTGG